MTPDQREALREVLHDYRASECIGDTIDSIAAIMQPKWLPVAGLVRDERLVLAGGWDDEGDEFETRFIEASDVCSDPDMTHYCELPAKLPSKGGEDAE